MKRLAWASTVITVLLLADGLWMQLSGYQPGDQNPFFGNPRLILSDGEVMLVSAAFFAVGTALMWWVMLRGRHPGTPAGRPGRPRA